eukprot:TRINITY_DN32700_c0_g1_i2.p1 TRINITY_DN32700_c0_g1~~TRINITY_DN32700_c0_g1_i2.p1  ORF type:complete len:353 (+),score=73.57 TRINITY_DN32700_c0_g1_i2:36-1094(+)
MTFLLPEMASPYPSHGDMIYQSALAAATQYRQQRQQLAAQEPSSIASAGSIRSSRRIPEPSQSTEAIFSAMHKRHAQVMSSNVSSFGYTPATASRAAPVAASGSSRRQATSLSSSKILGITRSTPLQSGTAAFNLSHQPKQQKFKDSHDDGIAVHACNVNIPVRRHLAGNSVAVQADECFSHSSGQDAKESNDSGMKRLDILNDGMWLAKELGFMSSHSEEPLKTKRKPAPQLVFHVRKAWSPIFASLPQSEKGLGEYTQYLGLLFGHRVERGPLEIHAAQLCPQAFVWKPPTAMDGSDLQKRLKAIEENLGAAQRQFLKEVFIPWASSVEEAGVRYDGSRWRDQGWMGLVQ